MNHAGVETIEKEYLKTELPEFKVGDTVKVSQRIQEGEKSRIQNFEGVVIRYRGNGTGRTFTVLRSDRNDTVEKVFALHSPLVEAVKVVKPAKKRKIHRSKLYNLRKK